jgi:hypothetical protein
MNTYKRHRFPPDIISYAVWLYRRFNLSHRDIEDLLAQRGITVTGESTHLRQLKHSLRSWGRPCIKFGAIYTHCLKRKHRGYGVTFPLRFASSDYPDSSVRLCPRIWCDIFGKRHRRNPHCDLLHRGQRGKIELSYVDAPYTGVVTCLEVDF